MENFNGIKEKIDYCSNEKKKQVKKGERPSFKGLNKDKTTVYIDPKNKLTIEPGIRYKNGPEHQEGLYPIDLRFYLNDSLITTNAVLSILFSILYNCKKKAGFDKEKYKILECIKDASNFEDVENKKKSKKREGDVDTWL